MRHRLLRIASCAVVVLLLAISSVHAEPLLLCGMAEVFLIETEAAADGDVKKLWSWRAKERDDLPEAMRGLFGTTAECKSREQGTKILIASSSGGCAVVERPSGRVVWYAQVPNAHSLELLPNDRIVVAASVHKLGNRLVVFDLNRSNQPLAETPLVSAHGVIWDAAQQRLWALGFDQLRCYELQDWASESPKLAVAATFALPDSGGHDLAAAPTGDTLFISTSRRVFRFDRQTHEFQPHATLGERAKVKSLDVHPRTGRTVFTHGSDQAWWNDRFGLLDTDATIPLPNERVYKARWLN